jgi:hypothetical protein
MFKDSTRVVIELYDVISVHLKTCLATAKTEFKESTVERKIHKYRRYEQKKKKIHKEQ